MIEFVMRLVKSKTFHVAMLAITATVEEFLRGAVTLHAAGLIIAGFLVAIFLLNAIKKGFEEFAPRLGLSPAAVERLESTIEQLIADGVASHHGSLVSHLTARGLDAGTAEAVANSFVAGVKEGLPDVPTVAVAVAAAEKAGP